MAELLSVGLDVGTTTSQMIVSELTVENRASPFAVPELEIGQRQVRYRGEVAFTPLLRENLVDAQALGRWLEEEFHRAGITRNMVDTGAVIITGETSRRENARAVMEALADAAGDFVVATAGPDLESVLCAKGSGAVAHSAETGQRVLHMDIGGGTSNLSLISDGKILRTGCLNVGGRLIRVDEDGVITYVSPVLAGLTDLKAGQRPALEAVKGLARHLVQALEMAAGLRQPDDLLTRLFTREMAETWIPPEEECTISFSGGVAACMETDFAPFAFGDMGPVLAEAIGESRLCKGNYLLGRETIRATVIGAGCHSAQLSGSTVFHRNVPFPLKNLPVLPVETGEIRTLSARLRQQDFRPVVALQGFAAPSYSQVSELAELLLEQMGDGPVYLCIEQDMAKALGQAMALRRGKDCSILCLDRVKISAGSFLDVGAPIGPAMPVVVKTLVLEKQEEGRFH